MGQERGDHIRLGGDAMVGQLPPMQDLADDVESEGDEDIPDDEMDDGGGEDGDSEVLPGGGKARLTARQAVLASMVGADHVELGKWLLMLFIRNTLQLMSPFNQKQQHLRARSSSRLKKLLSDAKRLLARERT